VLCEKPLAILPEQLDDIGRVLQDIEESEGRFNPLLVVGYNRRFAPLAIRLVNYFRERSEPLVASYRINAGYLPGNHWLHDPQQGGGRIIGEGCHFIDFLTFLVGQAPRSVSAHGLPDEGSYHEDNVVITLSFPDGSLGTVSYLANGDKSFPKERIEVFSGGRAAVLDDFRSLELVHEGHRKTARSRLRQDKGHQAIWQAFIEAINADSPPLIPYGQLLGVSQAAFAAVESLRTGEKIVIHPIWQGE
jgi:predicted dehydrogenase